MKNLALGLVLVCIALGGWWVFGDHGSAPGDLGVSGLIPGPAAEPSPEPASEPASELPASATPATADIPSPGVSQQAAPQRAPLVLTVEQGVFGRVTRPGGEPVVGRSVVVSILQGGKRSSQARGKTNASGAYAVAYPLRAMGLEFCQSRADARERWMEQVLENLGDNAEGLELPEQMAEILFPQEKSMAEPAWVEVAVQDGQGFRATKQITLRENMPGSIRVDLLLERRRDIEGEVLGSSGRQPGADVSLFDVEWNLVGRTRSDHQGKFRMKGPPPGSFRIHARMVGVGAGQVGGIYVGGGIRTPYQVIQLNGGMSLGGVVVTPTGEKVAGLRLAAVADVLAQAAQDPEWPTLRELAQAEAPGALCYSEAITGPKGTFSMEAMEGGFYQLRFVDALEKFQPKGLWRTSKDNRIVFSACMLTVILKGKPGDLLDVRVHCVETVNLARPKERKMRHFVRDGDFGGAQFVLEPGSSWDVFVSRYGKQQRPVSVPLLGTEKSLRGLTVNVKPWIKVRPQKEQELPPKEDLCTLEIQLSDKQGKKYHGLARVWRLEPSGLKLVVNRQQIPHGGFEGLEPGEYQVAVESAAGLASFLPLSVERLTSLVPGGRAKLQLRVEPGGWLQLDLAGSDEHQTERFTARLVPAEEGAQEIVLSFDPQGEGDFAPILRLGQSARCAPVLRAGTYELLVSSSISDIAIPGRTIKIEGGKISIVSVDVPDVPD